jgi:hypothetical protein
MVVGIKRRSGPVGEIQKGIAVQIRGKEAGPIAPNGILNRKCVGIGFIFRKIRIKTGKSKKQWDKENECSHAAILNSCFE